MAVRVYKMCQEYCTIAEMESRSRSRRLMGQTRAVQDDDGDEPFAPIVDDECALMHLPHERIGPVLDSWPTDLRFRVNASNTSCDVFFNPSAFICTSRFRGGVSNVCGNDAEWLPVIVEPIGEMYVFHPTRSVSLGPGAKYERHGSGNMTWISKYDFENPLELPTCFLIEQPPDSPAGMGAWSYGGIYITDALRKIMWVYRGVDFTCVFERG
jgi:hypothetical protein